MTILMSMDMLIQSETSEQVKSLYTFFIGEISPKLATFCKHIHQFGLVWYFSTLWGYFQWFIFSHLGGLTQIVIGKKGLLSSFPHCMYGKWTEEQGPELSSIHICICALVYGALYCSPVCLVHLWPCVWSLSAHVHDVLLHVRPPSLTYLGPGVMLEPYARHVV